MGVDAAAEDGNQASSLVRRCPVAFGPCAAERAKRALTWRRRSRESSTTGTFDKAQSKLKAPWVLPSPKALSTWFRCSTTSSAVA